MNDRKKKWLIIIIVINIVLLLAGGVLSLLGRQDNITLYDIPLRSSSGEYDDGDENFFSTEYPVSRYWFLGRTGPLTSGVYTITVYYNAQGDHYNISCDTGSIDGKAYPAVYAESYTLSGLYHSFEYRIWVNSSIDNLNIRIGCGEDEEMEEFFEGDSSLYVDKIEIVRDYRETVFYRFIRFALLLFFVDAVIAVFWNLRRIKENIYVVLGLTCIFMVSSLSVMAKFSTEGHDSGFHFARIVGLSGALLSGNLPVRIQPDWLHGYGYAASVCYGDVLLYIPAILYALGAPLLYVYKLYVLLINAGTLFISYLCFRKISGSKYIGIACSALYCLSITRLLNMYLRAAVGEYSAFMFLPLILLGMKEIYDVSNDECKNYGWLYLCLGMTGIIQTHVLSVEMVGIFIAITVLIVIKRMSKSVFSSFLKSVIATICLNLGFLIPFLDYAADSLKVFADKSVYGIQYFGLSLYELLSFGTTATGKAVDALNGPAERIPESLGMGMLVAILLTMIILAKCRDWKQNEKGQLLLTAALGCLAAWMSTYYFPWNRLAALPVLKNIVASIQFPWRFLSITVPLLTYMACLALVKFGETFGKEKLSYLLIGICMICAFQGLFCQDLMNRNAQGYQMVYDNRSNLNVSRIVSSGEYLLEDTNVDLTWTDLDVTGENVIISDTDRNGTQMDVACQAGEHAWLEFPMFAYKYYRCKDISTGETYSVIRGTNNKIHIDLPDNYQGTLKVYFAEPWYWRVSEIISLITLVWLLRLIACSPAALRFRNRLAG